MTQSTTWWGVRILAIIALLFLALPVVAILIRVPWSDLQRILAQPDTLQAFGLSLGTAFSAAVLCAVLGTSLALWLAARRTRWATLIRIIVLVPLVLPPLVGGVALLAVFGQTGLLGPSLIASGIRIPFTTLAVILAQVFVALPFMVITVEAALVAGGQDYSRVARGLGASHFTTLRRVTLPILSPAILAGGLLSFARALGEFGATSLFAGSTPGITRTVPQAVAAAFQGTSFTESAGYAMAGILVFIAVLVVFAAGLWKTPLQRGGSV